MRPDERPLAQIKHKRNTGADILSYLHADHLNTPRLATDATQTIVWRWAGDAFGATPPDDDPDADGIAVTVNLRFPGQYFDRETGLHYNWNRYYDPKTGRYITSDPIGLFGELNTYAYVTNNPLRFIDPRGLDRICGPGRTWIPDERKHGHGTCVDNDKPNEDACFGADCKFFPAVTNTQCMAKCMAEPDDLGGPRSVCGLLPKLLGAAACEVVKKGMRCTRRCEQEMKNGGKPACNGEATKK